MSKQIDIMDFPYFHGTKDPYVYLRWVQQIEEIFDSLKYFDYQKCRITSRKFFGYAAMWWEDFMSMRRMNGYSGVRNWEVMKKYMTRYFIPKDVRDKFYVKLQRLKQSDDMCVDKYIKKFKLFVIASDVGDFERWKVTKFMSGLKHEIAERIELVVQFEPFISLQDVFDLALKNEKEERVYEQKIICEFMKNESVEVIEVVEQ